jgi:hypothetical protein
MVASTLFSHQALRNIVGAVVLNPRKYAALLLGPDAANPLRIRKTTIMQRP